MVATFQQAYAEARDSYTAQQWPTLKIAEQSAAIYRAMRRIDTEDVEQVARRATNADELARPDVPDFARY